LKQFKFPLLVTGPHGEFGYADVLKALLQNPVPGAAIGLDEMRASLRVLDAIDTAVAAGAPYVLVDQAGATLIKDKIRQAQWQRVSREALDFSDAMLAAEEVETDIAA